MKRFFSSMKFGLIIMFAIAISSTISTLIPLGKEQPIFYKYLFKALLILPRLLMLILCINLLLCTLRRLPSLIKQFKDNNSLGKLSLLAPFLLHLGIVIVLIGALLGNYLGEKEQIQSKTGVKVKIPEHISQNMFITIDNFTTIYDKHNNIANWQSDITLTYLDNLQVHGTTKVNHPFKFKGLVFYQTAYSYLFNVSFTTNENKVHDFTIPNSFVNVDAADLLGKNFFIRKHNEEIQLFVFESHENYKIISLQKGQFIKFPTGTLQYLGITPKITLTVKKDPGKHLVMLGFLIITFSSVFFWIRFLRKKSYPKQINKL